MQNMAFQTSYETQAECSTEYRLRPNPDAPIEAGFRCGAIVEWRDTIEEGWKGYFYVAPECLEAMSKMFALAATEANS